MDAARHHQPDHRQRLAAWLGLLATLLLYLAPLASQALARHHNLHGGHQGHHHAPAQPTAAHHGAHQGHPAQPAPQHHGGHGMAHELCGYCTLLGQLSWLGPAQRLALALAHPGRAQPPLPPPAIFPALPRPPFQARAPPG
ncbi:DUF2946 family protein [Zobellella iuensis]|uniref:DUF2946 family protein n=1 Tax=Zobellella iuensis TaxID=2803811 RepID=A0ABS1QMU3_9GAMM|nr:DUF2946 family protein [Zobellella iuensis]MBL1376179.1 DUF2946 family protein [Zobellella iuensis]